jgi:hypothetical protein
MNEGNSDNVVHSECDEVSNVKQPANTNAKRLSAPSIVADN